MTWSASDQGVGPGTYKGLDTTINLGMFIQSPMDLEISTNFLDPVDGCLISLKLTARPLKINGWKMLEDEISVLGSPVFVWVTVS